MQQQHKRNLELPNGKDSGCIVEQKRLHHLCKVVQIVIEFVPIKEERINTLLLSRKWSF